MTDWKHRWVCPHWEFLFYQEDAPDVPFSERDNEGAATFVDILNTRGHDVSIRVDFYKTDGTRDHRFGLEGVVSNKSVWAYRTDTGPNFPKPAPGKVVSAQGWFEVRSTEPVFLAAYVTASEYTAHSRAWGFSLPFYEWPYDPPAGAAKTVGSWTVSSSSGTSPAPKPHRPRAAKRKSKTARPRRAR